MSDKFKIRLNVAGSTYPMTIEREMEEKYRRAEKEINQLVSMYRGMYVADKEQCLGMAAIKIAVEKVELEMSRSLGDDIEALAQLDKTLGDYLSEGE